jgi:hypothetical protein
MKIKFVLTRDAAFHIPHMRYFLFNKYTKYLIETNPEECERTYSDFPQLKRFHNRFVRKWM